MGYLDKQSRVIDIVLTERGRRLYAAGELEFSFFGLFDDGIDYDPFYTGSLSEEERALQIESTPMLEAPFIKDIRGTVAPLEPTSHIFTASPGYVRIPHMTEPDESSVDLRADQRRDGGTYSRTGTNSPQIELYVDGDTERGNPGFLVRVLSSGSNGLQPLPPRHDLSGRRAYDSFIAMAVDNEDVLDKPKIEDPSSIRSSRPPTRKA